jgi:DNA-directed RNA polymerase subunit RPC12/RpoP
MRAMRPEEGMSVGKTPTAPEAGAGRAAGLGVTPAERTYLNIEVGVYKCIDCGAAMLSLVERDETGHVVLREIPLVCPNCASLSDWASAAKRAVKEARTLAEARKLVAQLFDLEIPAPYEGEEE